MKLELKSIRAVESEKETESLRPIALVTVVHPSHLATVPPPQTAHCKGCLYGSALPRSWASESSEIFCERCLANGSTALAGTSGTTGQNRTRRSWRPFRESESHKAACKPHPALPDKQSSRQ